MKLQNLSPYTTIENEDFPVETILIITQKEFLNIPFQDGRITFTFHGCKFKNIRIENPEKIEFEDISIQFVSCFIESIDSYLIKTDNISLHFSSTILSGNVQGTMLKSVSLNNCIISSNLFLFHQNKIDISYTGENVYPIRWKKLLKSLGITNYVDLIKTKQSYQIIDSKKITFRTNLNENRKEGVFRNSHQKLEEYKVGYHFSKRQLDLFNINLSIKYSEEIENLETKITDSFLNSLSLRGYSNGQIFVENTKIQNWFIRDFSTKKEATFYNISPLKLTDNTSKIEIHKCNLDNTWFDNTDFSEYKVVSFFRTKFGKTTFTSCNFPTDYTSFEKFKSLENVHYPEKVSDNYYKNQYEIFLQLKLLLESTGNFYESQKLQAISNDALKKINQISNWDKAILWINSKSNNHGLSIKQPLLYFLAFSIVCYILYLMCLGRIFNSNKIDYSLFGYYFSFIDITHRTDFLVTKDEFNFGSLSIDFISKLISGFFIYQFISSFRKYGKR